MSDGFWLALFGFLGLAMTQILLHMRAMRAQLINTQLTVAAATGKPDVPLDSTQLKEVVKSVATGKKETLDAANKVAHAMNGELSEKINKIVSDNVGPIQEMLAFRGEVLKGLAKSQADINEAMRVHQIADESNMLEVRNSLAAIIERQNSDTEKVLGLLRHEKNHHENLHSLNKQVIEIQKQKIDAMQK